MATEKPRFSVTMDHELLEQVEEYRHKERFKTQSKAIVELVRCGLAEFSADVKKAPSVSDEAMEVAEAYDGADPGIRYSVRKLLDLDVPDIKMVARGGRVKRLSGKPDAREIDEAISETPSEP